MAGVHTLPSSSTTAAAAQQLLAATTAAAAAAAAGGGASGAAFDLQLAVAPSHYVTGDPLPLLAAGAPEDLLQAAVAAWSAAVAHQQASTSSGGGGSMAYGLALGGSSSSAQVGFAGPAADMHSSQTVPAAAGGAGGGFVQEQAMPEGQPWTGQTLTGPPPASLASSTSATSLTSVTGALSSGAASSRRLLPAAAATAAARLSPGADWPALHGGLTLNGQKLEVQLAAGALGAQPLQQQATVAAAGGGLTSGSSWSAPVKLDLVGSSRAAAVVKLPCVLPLTVGTTATGASFMSLQVEPVQGAGSTWALYMLPAYLLVNRLPTAIELRQHGTTQALQTVPPGAHCSVIWPSPDTPLKLQIRLLEPGCSWSGATALDQPGESLLKLRQKHQGTTRLLQLLVRAVPGGGVVAVVSGASTAFAPYRIDNCSSVVLHVQQARCLDQEDVLQPYSSLQYTWDEPSLPHQVRLTQSLLMLWCHAHWDHWQAPSVAMVCCRQVPPASKQANLHVA